MVFPQLTFFWFPLPMRASQPSAFALPALTSPPLDDFSQLLLNCEGFWQHRVSPLRQAQPVPWSSPFPTPVFFRLN